MRFTDIDINFDVTYEGHQKWSKILSMDILRVFSKGIGNNGVQGVWGTWAMGTMGHMGNGGNGAHGQWGTGVWST